MKILIPTILIFFISCSSVRMKRPEPLVYQSLKEEELFGLWGHSRGWLRIRCSGAFEFLERRDGKEFNKDKGGEISQLDREKKEIIVSTPVGKNHYSYEKTDTNSLKILVGKRAPIVEGAKYVASFLTYVQPDRPLTFIKEESIDCDREPETLSEVFQDMATKFKKGEFKAVPAKKP